MATLWDASRTLRNKCIAGPSTTVSTPIPSVKAVSVVLCSISFSPSSSATKKTRSVPELRPFASDAKATRREKTNFSNALPVSQYEGDANTFSFERIFCGS